MKKFFVLFLLSVAGFGCTYAKTSPAELRDLQLKPDASQETKPEAAAPASDEDGDVVLPENPSPDATETPEAPVEEPAEEPAEEVDQDSLCPSGWTPQGTATLCCRIDDPQTWIDESKTCMIVDPGPGDGGVKPTVDGISPVDAEIVDDGDDPTTPPPPPPDGGIQDSDSVHCFDGDSSDDTRRRRQEGVTPGTGEEVLDANDCVMVRVNPQGGKALRERLQEAVRERLSDA